MEETEENVKALNNAMNRDYAQASPLCGLPVHSQPPTSAPIENDVRVVCEVGEENCNDAIIVSIISKRTQYNYAAGYVSVYID